MLTYFGLVGYGGACCARRWLCSHVLKVLRFLSSLMPGGREFHTVLLRVVVYVARCAALLPLCEWRLLCECTWVIVV